MTAARVVGPGRSGERRRLLEAALPDAVRRRLPVDM